MLTTWMNPETQADKDFVHLGVIVMWQKYLFMQTVLIVSLQFLVI